MTRKQIHAILIKDLQRGNNQVKKLKWLIVLCAAFLLCACSPGGAEETDGTAGASGSMESSAETEKTENSPEDKTPAESPAKQGGETAADASTDEAYEPETESGSYRDAVSEEELAAARKTAEDYYGGTTYRVTELTVAEDDCSWYGGKTPGTIIIFISEDLDRGNMTRYITLEKGADGTWTVINEGF